MSDGEFLIFGADPGMVARKNWLNTASGMRPGCAEVAGQTGRPYRTVAPSSLKLLEEMKWSAAVSTANALLEFQAGASGTLSSWLWSRSDPLTGRIAMHTGLDSRPRVANLRFLPLCWGMTLQAYGAYGNVVESPTAMVQNPLRARAYPGIKKGDWSAKRPADCA